MKRLNYLLFSVFLLGFFTSLGQTVSSTYSDNGIGLLNYQGLPRNMGMGEIGYATPSSWSMNLINPAFLPLNRYSMFQVGIEMDRRNMESSEFSANKTSGGLRFLNYAFPIVNGKWTSAFGLTPFSNSSLRKFSREELVDGNVEVTQLINSGGLSSMHWSNGFRLQNQLYFGFKTSFLFGSVDYEENRGFQSQNSFTSQFSDETAYSGVKFDLAAGYRHQLDDEKWLNFGFIYEIQKDINGTRVIELESQLSNTNTTIEEQVSYTLPSVIGLGIAYHVANNFTIGSDLTISKWSDGGRDSDVFVNTTKVAFGGEWTPDYSNVNNYWGRVSYRLGINFDNLPYEIDGQQINEVGVNFGASFPIGLSSLDMAFKYGRLGTQDNGLIRENYFRIVIGATMNDRWFIKRRYD